MCTHGEMITPRNSVFTQIIFLSDGNLITAVWLFFPVETLIEGLHASPEVDKDGSHLVI